MATLLQQKFPQLSLQKIYASLLDVLEDSGVEALRGTDVCLSASRKQ
jgi:hypothetical protein